METSLENTGNVINVYIAKFQNNKNIKKDDFLIIRTSYNKNHFSWY